MGSLRRLESSHRKSQRVFRTLEAMHLRQHGQFRLRQLRQLRSRIDAAHGRRAWNGHSWTWNSTNRDYSRLVCDGLHHDDAQQKGADRHWRCWNSWRPLFL